LRTLRLAEPRDSAPEDVVGWLGAVQSQDYGPAKWAVGQRIRGAMSTDAAIDRAFNAGSILRTHVLRPTWHFVLPADIRWLLDLTGARVLAQNVYMCRREGLDDATQATANALFARALQGGKHLTRKELELVLTTGGIAAATGFRIGYLLMNSELRGLICSGALSGKQHTYALLDERAPPAQARRLNRDEALAELTRRYFTSHGPATIKDFRWWSSLKVTEIRAGLAMVAHQLEHADIDGATYWFGLPPPVTRPPSPTVHQLQGYDEYIVGYSETKFALDSAGTARATAGNDVIFNMIVLLDSQVAGHWKRTLKRDAVHIEIALYTPFDAAQTDALYAACARHAEFLGLDLTVAVSPIVRRVTGDRPPEAFLRRNPADATAGPVAES
jgi:hypothetical protein